MQHLKKKILLIFLTLFFTNSQAGVGDKIFKLTQNYSDEEIERRIEEKLILSYKDIPQLNYIKGEDKKEGRSLFDRPDVSEDYQIHFIYMLSSLLMSFNSPPLVLFLLLCGCVFYIFFSSSSLTHSPLSRSV